MHAKCKIGYATVILVMILRNMTKLHTAHALGTRPSLHSRFLSKPSVLAKVIRLNSIRHLNIVTIFQILIEFGYRYQITKPSFWDD